MRNFEPDFHNILNAARNIEAKRLPLYDHVIAEETMEEILGIQFRGLLWGNDKDKDEYFKNLCAFYKAMGYDTVTFEACIGPVMPGSGALGGHKEGVIKTRQDFEKYPWDEIPNGYFSSYSGFYKALGNNMPQGM